VADDRGSGEAPSQERHPGIRVFLHLSQEEQPKRFLERIDEPDKNWKFSLADIHERKYWSQYMKAYEACLSASSTRQAP
jgi:polyphosphate kinase 2 (PPK2 family)